MKDFSLNAPTPLVLHLPNFNRVNLTLVGCGGTGSHIASGLVALDLALAERGIGMNILLCDPDSVEQKNVGRQLFAWQDVGRPKAEVIAERLNQAFGARIGAACRAITPRDNFTDPEPDVLNILIGAVDNSKARAAIAQQVKYAKRRLWWLDCGNEHHSGQVILGNCAEAEELKGTVGLGMVDRLPPPSVVYPDLIVTEKRQLKHTNGRAPSCAELVAAGEQGLMVNRMVAAWACALLYDFVVARAVKYFALTFNLEWGGTKVYTVDLPTLAEVTGLTEPKLLATAK